MLITNGDIIIAATADWDVLKEQVEELQSRARGDLDNSKLKFKPNKKEGHFIIPKEVDTMMLLKLAKPNIDLVLRSIKGEEIQLPKNKIRSIKYEFSQDELAKIGGEMAMKFGEKNAEESALSRIKKKYKTEIDNIEAEIKENADKITQGYEMREHTCVVKLNFHEKKKYFIHPDSGDVLDVADLDPEDYQLSMTLSDPNILEESEDGENLPENEHLNDGDPFLEDNQEKETPVVNINGEDHPIALTDQDGVTDENTVLPEEDLPS